MKLLYITNGINGSGGLERVLSVKASMLADDYNYEVHILTLNDGDRNPFYSFSPLIEMHSITVRGNPIQYFLQYKRGIQRIVNQIQPNVISVCDDGLKGFFVPSLVRIDAKIIYERHVSKLIEARENQSFIKKISTQIKWALMAQRAKSFEQFIVLTDGNKNEWTGLNNIQVISNPLSFYGDHRATLDNKTVICVGKIAYQKGQDILISIWKKIHKKYPDWKLELYGKADESFLVTEDLEKHKIYYHPPVKDIESKYLASSIYVMASRFEGFGMVLIEAMACGVPCISFDCDYGPSDIIKDNKDGFLVENGDVESFGQKLMELMDNPGLRKALGKKAKENVKRYSAKEIVKQWDELFRSL